jgi:hypothetical protein
VPEAFRRETPGFLASGIWCLQLSAWWGICGLLGWSGEQQAKWTDRAERYELKRHQPRLTERQVVEKRVRFLRVPSEILHEAVYLLVKRLDVWEVR